MKNSHVLFQNCSFPDFSWSLSKWFPDKNCGWVCLLLGKDRYWQVIVGVLGMPLFLCPVVLIRPLVSWGLPRMSHCRSRSQLTMECLTRRRRRIRQCSSRMQLCRQEMPVSSQMHQVTFDLTLQFIIMYKLAHKEANKSFRFSKRNPFCNLDMAENISNWISLTGLSWPHLSSITKQELRILFVIVFCFYDFLLNQF